MKESHVGGGHTGLCLCPYAHSEHRRLSDALLDDRGLHTPPPSVALLWINPDTEAQVNNEAGAL